jgi:hypothetical protein
MAFGERIDRLADAVEATWAKAGHDRSALPDICTEALEAAALHNQIDYDGLLSHVAGAESFPQQIDPMGSFGSPPITLRFRERFAVDLYFWPQPEVDIHNHSFDGAFTVLTGRSLQTTFRFDADHEEVGPVMVGPVEGEAVELLQTGAVRPIRGTVSMVHQVIHLSTECASLVVRSLPDPTDPPIYTFLPPRCAMLQSRYMSQSDAKKLALLDLFKTTRPEQFDELVVKTLAEIGELGLAWALRSLRVMTQDHEKTCRLAERLGARPWTEALLESVAETDTFEIHPRHLTEERHRLFLFLIRATTDRGIRDRIVGELEPGMGFKEASITWLGELSQMGLVQPPMPEHILWALAELAAGASDADLGRSLAERYGEAMGNELSGQVTDMRTYFANHPLFRRIMGPI